MKLDCILTDVCLCDFFSGDCRPWVCVPAIKGCSLKDLKMDLHSELNMGAIGGNDPITRDDSGKDGDRWFKAAHAAIDRLQYAEKGKRGMFKDLPDQGDEDFCELPMAYFVFVKA